MKITVYTVKDCAFSKQEKEYLTSHTLQYEEKDLELNKEYLTEMLAVSNNFAGTPVTKIEKDDGTIIVLKGFTQSEFDTALGFTPTEAPKEAAAANPATVTPEVKTENVSSQAAAVTTDSVAPSAEAKVVTPPAQPAPSEPLNDVLDKLENNMNQDVAQAPATPASAPVAEPTPPPITQTPQDPGQGMPSVPDFPTGDLKAGA